uniref:Uncharacterized protein n=1 Tax=Globodera rostochiensis TaxID=31243 RepID=A0A914H976_GLORO
MFQFVHGPGHEEHKVQLKLSQPFSPSRVTGLNFELHFGGPKRPVRLPNPHTDRQFDFRGICCPCVLQNNSKLEAGTMVVFFATISRKRICISEIKQWLVK